MGFACLILGMFSSHMIWWFDMICSLKGLGSATCASYRWQCPKRGPSNCLKGWRGSIDKVSQVLLHRTNMKKMMKHKQGHQEVPYVSPKKWLASTFLILFVSFFAQSICEEHLDATWQGDHSAQHRHCRSRWWQGWCSTSVKDEKNLKDAHMKCQNAFQSGAESSPKTLPFFQANSYSKFGLFGVETDWTGTLTWRWLARDYFSLLQFFWLTLVHTLSGAACIWTSHTLHCHTDVFARRSLWHSLPVQYRNISRNRSVYFGYAMIYCSLDWCLFDSSIIQQVTCVKVTFAIWSSLLNNGVNTGVPSSQCSTWGQSDKRVEKQKVSSHVPMGSFYRSDILPQKDVFWAVRRFPPSLKL